MAITQSLCEYNSKLYAAWKGEVGDDRVFYAARSGDAWDSATTIPGNSSTGPSLAAMSDKLYAAWKGEHGDNRIFYAAFDGTNWDNQSTIPGNSSVGPVLAVFNGKLYAAWKGEEADQRLFYSSFNGTWAAQALVPGVASSIGPSLAVFGGKLYAAWRGASNDQSLWYASFDGSWSTQQQIPGASSSTGPSLCAFGGKLYAAWKGASGDQGLYYASFDGSWSAKKVILGIASSIGPALGEYGNKLCAMWKGANSDQRLFYASFDGSEWSAETTLPGNTGQDLPQNIGLRMQYQESSEWCWIAVATSINHFYNPVSTATQCAVMSGVIKELTGGNTSCCPTAAVLAANPVLKQALADPYVQSAYEVLDNPAAGIIGGLGGPCLKTGGVGDALDVNNNWNNGGSRYNVQTSVSLAQIQSEIGAGRPIAVDIVWNGGPGHCVAIAGVLNDLLLICDPANGESVIPYEDFPAGYYSGATLNSVCLTQKG